LSARGNSIWFAPFKTKSSETKLQVTLLTLSHFGLIASVRYHTLNGSLPFNYKTMTILHLRMQSKVNLTSNPLAMESHHNVGDWSDKN